MLKRMHFNLVKVNQFRNNLVNLLTFNCIYFFAEIRDLEIKFTALAEAEVDFLLKKNRAFIKESKLFQDGGEYSEEEVNWYESMIQEIDT